MSPGDDSNRYNLNSPTGMTSLKQSGTNYIAFFAGMRGEFSFVGRVGKALKNSSWLQTILQYEYAVVKVHQ